MNRRAFCSGLLQAPFLSWAPRLRAYEEHIDQAVCCLADAWTSMRAGFNFFHLQELAIATALRNPCVAQRLLGSDDKRSAFSLIAWASADKQVVAIPWTIIRGEQDLLRLAHQAERISWPYALKRYNQTGLGMALWVAVEYISQMPFGHASRRIINVSSNGKNNHGITPDMIRAMAHSNSITINAIIMQGQAPSFDLEDLAAYYRQNVLTGDVLVEVAAGPNGRGDFVDGMISKFCAELA
jgi:Protein of unknown function (DUF1194)